MQFSELDLSEQSKLGVLVQTVSQFLAIVDNLQTIMLIHYHY
jgi:hypothetical protein